jgi:hypothetical protein
LFDPVPTRYDPSAAPPVPFSVRYQPVGRTFDGVVPALVNVSKVCVNPEGAGIDTDPLPDDPAASAPMVAAERMERVINAQEATREVMSCFIGVADTIQTR